MHESLIHIPMRDGCSLAADLYRPSSDGRFPTILIQTPYGRGQFRPAMRGEDTNHGLFDRSRFAFVIVDGRGFRGLKSASQNVTSSNLGQDGFDAVEWIATHAWSNGLVGTWGPSALGRVQYLTAFERPPHLRCCVPLIAAGGPPHYDEYYDNGVLRRAYMDTLAELGIPADERVRQATTPTDPFYQTSHPFGPINHLDVPVFVITGWYDPGAARHLEMFETIRTQAGTAARSGSKLLVGPWHHTAVGLTRQGELLYRRAAGESDRMAKLFLEYWLCDRKDNGWDRVPTYQWWQMGEDRWCSADRPGAVQTAEKTFYLGADGSLSWVAPTSSIRERTFVCDPANPVPTVGGANLSGLTGSPPAAGPCDQRAIELRDDVLVYTTEVLPASLRIYGSVNVGVKFATDKRDVNLAARLSDVYPDGRSMLIVDGITRGKNARIIEHSPSTQAGRLAKATLRLPPTATTIVAGHRLRVSICGSNYPRFELNPHTGEDHFNPDAALTATCTVVHGGDCPAGIDVPTLVDRRSRQP